jgi:hypothetical protein
MMNYDDQHFVRMLSRHKPEPIGVEVILRARDHGGHGWYPCSKRRSMSVGSTGPETDSEPNTVSLTLRRLRRTIADHLSIKPTVHAQDLSDSASPIFIKVTVKLREDETDSSPVHSPRKSFARLAPDLSWTASRLQACMRSFLDCPHFLVDLDDE